MNDLISPKYLMKLVKDINEAILAEYKSYKEARLYIDKWHEEEREWNHHWENFEIKIDENGDIDLLLTLHNIDGQTLLKVAIDLGVDTPDFIPSIPTFRNEIKSDYKTASATFDKAFRQIEDHPDIAIGLANSALESIIKKILKDTRIKSKISSSRSLYKLSSEILNIFKLYPDSQMPEEIKIIGSSLLAVTKGIEDIRSAKKDLHGRTDTDYFVTDSIYAYFIVNTVATVGRFLISFYRLKYPKVDEPNNDVVTDSNELPF